VQYVVGSGGGQPTTVDEVVTVITADPAVLVGYAADVLEAEIANGDLAAKVQQELAVSRAI
jgi:hypothetical protein